MEYTILYKTQNNYPTWLCDIFEDDELFKLTVEGWRVIG